MLFFQLYFYLLPLANHLDNVALHIHLDVANWILQFDVDFKQSRLFSYFSPGALANAFNNVSTINLNTVKILGKTYDQMFIRGIIWATDQRYRYPINLQVQRILNVSEDVKKYRCLLYGEHVDRWVFVQPHDKLLHINWTGFKRELLGNDNVKDPASVEGALVEFIKTKPVFSNITRWVDSYNDLVGLRYPDRNFRLVHGRQEARDFEVMRALVEEKFSPLSRLSDKDFLAMSWENLNHRFNLSLDILTSHRDVVAIKRMLESGYLSPRGQMVLMRECLFEANYVIEAIRLSFESESAELSSLIRMVITEPFGSMVGVVFNFPTSTHMINIHEFFNWIGEYNYIKLVDGKYAYWPEIVESPIYREFLKYMADRKILDLYVNTPDYLYNNMCHRILFWEYYTRTRYIPLHLQPLADNLSSAHNAIKRSAVLQGNYITNMVRTMAENSNKEMIQDVSLSLRELFRSKR